jgi:hypothetical protein
MRFFVDVGFPEEMWVDFLDAVDELAELLETDIVIERPENGQLTEPAERRIFVQPAHCRKTEAYILRDPATYVPLAWSPIYGLLVLHDGVWHRITEVHFDEYSHEWDFEPRRGIGLELETDNMFQTMIIATIIGWDPKEDASIGGGEFTAYLGTRRAIEKFLGLLELRRYRGWKKFPVSTHMHVSWYWMLNEDIIWSGLEVANEYFESLETEAAEKMFGRTFNGYARQKAAWCYEDRYAALTAPEPNERPTWEFRLPRIQEPGHFFNAVKFLYWIGVKAYEKHLTKSYEVPWTFAPERPFEWYSKIARKIREDVYRPEDVLILFDEEYNVAELESELRYFEDILSALEKEYLPIKEEI